MQSFAAISTAAIVSLFNSYNFNSALIQGTQYGDNEDGIMDWIDNTGGYSSSGGLDSKPYNWNTGTSKTTFRANIKSWLIDGINPLGV